MSIATKLLSKQKRAYFSVLLQGLVLLAIGLIGGIMVLINGAGEAAEGSKGQWLQSMLGKLSILGGDPEKWAQYGVAALLFIAAAAGLYYLIKGLKGMSARRTPLGKSVLNQLVGSQTLEGALEEINGDMEEAYPFGPIYVGRKWILSSEAMRLGEISGVFWYNEGMEENILICIDKKKNVWSAVFRYEDDRDKAADYLSKTLSLLVSGNKQDMQAFISTLV